MKKLFFLLLVVNLVIWLWGQREQGARLNETAQPAVGTIRLLDDAQVAARREEARAVADTAPPAVAATASDSVDPSAPAVAERAPHDADAKPPAVEAAPSATAQVAQESGPAEPMPAAPAEAVVAAHGEPEPLDAVPVGDRDQASTTTPEAGVLVDITAAGHPAGKGTPLAGEPVPSTEPAVDTVAPAPIGPAAAMPELVREDAAPPIEPVVVAPTEESRPADTAVAGAVEIVPPAAEAAPPVQSRLPDVAPAPVPAESVPTVPETAPGPSPVGPPAATTIAAAVPPALPVEAREVRYLCESVGPFADRPAAVRFQAGLVAPVRGATVREERSARPVRQWVLAPVQPSKEATAQYLASLSQAGVKDAWRIPSGPLAGRLAVGVFQSAENARKHADMLAAKGVAAEVQAPKDLDPIRVYWVDYERPAGTAPPDPGAGKTQPVRQIVARSCGRVAGP